MARTLFFAVGMTVPDDDPTDPEQMAEQLELLLNAKRGTALDWHTYMHETVTDEARPVFTVIESTRNRNNNR